MAQADSGMFCVDHTGLKLLITPLPVNTQMLDLCLPAWDSLHKLLSANQIVTLGPRHITFK